MKLEQLLALVCKFYGLKVKDIKGQGLATSVPLSSWRHPIAEEARKIACFLIQKHCALSEDEVAAALKRQLQWTGVYIRMSAADARRKLSEDVAFRMSAENVERMLIMATLMKSMS